MTSIHPDVHMPNLYTCTEEASHRLSDIYSNIGQRLSKDFNVTDMHGSDITPIGYYI